MPKTRLRRAALALLCSAALSGAAHAAFSPESLLNDLRDAVNRFLPRVLEQRGERLRQLEASGDYDQAARYWSSEKEFFTERQQEYADVVERIAAALRQNFERSLAGPRARLQSLTEDAPAAGQWPHIRQDREALEAAIDTYGHVELMRDRPAGAEALAQARAVVAEANRKLEGAAPAAFRAFNHFGGRSFLAEYPVALPPAFFESNLPALRSPLASATQPQLESFVRTYAQALAGRERVLADTLYSGPTQPALAATRLLAVQQALTGNGLSLPASRTVTVVELVAPGAKPALSVSAPSGTTVVQEDPAQLRRRLAGTEGLLVVLQRVEMRTEQSTSDARKVTSQVVAPGTAKTPFAPYAFDTVQVSATKRSTVQVSVVDLSRGVLAQVPYTVSEQARFAVATGIRKEDPDFFALSQHYHTRASVDEFETAPPAVGLLDALTASGASPERNISSAEQGHAAIVGQIPTLTKKPAAQEIKPPLRSRVRKG